MKSTTLCKNEVHESWQCVFSMLKEAKSLVLIYFIFQIQKRIALCRSSKHTQKFVLPAFAFICIITILNCSAKWHECCAKRLKWHFGGWTLVLIQFARFPCVVVVFVEWQKIYSVFVHLKKFFWVSKVEENTLFFFLHHSFFTIYMSFQLISKTQKLKFPQL